jgi:hydroxymethylpyrimidine/phosphomethylpyrimidine kinase
MSATPTPPRVLIIAGSDSGGGAGIQADIKTVTALGGYAATAITALTAQNTLGVFGVHPVPPGFVRQQIELVLNDIGADVVKTGMLVDETTIAAVCDALGQLSPSVPIVVDPVMIAKGGESLLASSAVSMMRRRLLPLAAVITPNLPEAEVLSGMAIPDLPSMRHAAQSLLTLGVPAVLLKGGHLQGEMVVDLIATEDGISEFANPRIETRHTHGTGCTLASAIAVGLGRRMELADAVRQARAYVQAAISNAPGFGDGHGPLGHTVTIDRNRVAAL